MNGEVVVQIRNLKKMYNLGEINSGSLARDFQSWVERKRGEEDPNVRIDVDPNLLNGVIWSVDGVNLDVHRGEILGIIGSNGAGKSTLLKLITRITEPTEGEIRIKGKVASMLEVGTGFVLDMTGRENIFLNGAILGMTKKQVSEVLDEIIDFSECEEFLDTPVKRYSSGMFVKLAFSVASHLSSDVLIMDEVLAVGDQKFQAKCMKKMQDVVSDGNRTVFFVSHNMESIRKICTRAIVMKKGKIVFNGDVEEAIAEYSK